MATKKEAVNVPPQTETTVNIGENMAPEQSFEAAQVTTDSNALKLEDYFSPQSNARFQEDMLKAFGVDITNSAEYPEIVKDFARTFSVQDGFRLFLNKDKFAMQKGYPFTILVPLRFSSFDKETMDLIGCHRTTFHLPSLSYLNIKSLLDISLTTRANVLQYKKDNN